MEEWNKRTKEEKAEIKRRRRKRKGRRRKSRQLKKCADLRAALLQKRVSRQKHHHRHPHPSHTPHPPHHWPWTHCMTNLQHHERLFHHHFGSAGCVCDRRWCHFSGGIRSSSSRPINKRKHQLHNWSQSRCDFSRQ